MPGTSSAGRQQEAEEPGGNEGTKSPTGQTQKSGFSKGNGNKSEFETRTHRTGFNFWKYYYHHSGACLDAERRVRRHETGATGGSRGTGALFLLPESQKLFL